MKIARVLCCNCRMVLISSDTNRVRFHFVWHNLHNEHEWSEDYQGPTSSGFFKWVPDDNGQMRPVTRMKEKNLERNPQFWDRVYADNEDE
jgi:hypothetical protein